MYPDWLNKVIVCPETKKPLKLTGNCFQVDDKKYFIKDDILSAVFPEELIGDDAKFNRLYNIFAPFYDLNERVLGKLLTGVNMVEGRRKIISFLELKQGMRVLEVSPGRVCFRNLFAPKLVMMANWSRSIYRWEC